MKELIKVQDLEDKLAAVDFGNCSVSENEDFKGLCSKFEKLETENP